MLFLTMDTLADRSPGASWATATAELRSVAGGCTGTSLGFVCPRTSSVEPPVTCKDPGSTTCRKPYGTKVRSGLYRMMEGPRLHSLCGKFEAKLLC